MKLGKSKLWFVRSPGCEHRPGARASVLQGDSDIGHPPYSCLSGRWFGPSGPEWGGQQGVQTALKAEALLWLLVPLLKSATLSLEGSHEKKLWGMWRPKWITSLVSAHVRTVQNRTKGAAGTLSSLLPSTNTSYLGMPEATHGSCY